MTNTTDLLALALANELLETPENALLFLIDGEQGVVKKIEVSWSEASATEAEEAYIRLLIDSGKENVTQVISEERVNPELVAALKKRKVKITIEYINPKDAEYINPEDAEAIKQMDIGVDAGVDAK